MHTAPHRSSGILIALILFSSATLFAQPPAATSRTEDVPNQVQGRVLDPSRAPIGAARIAAVPGDGRPAGPEAVSGPQGDFTFTLAAGFYTFHISARGFKDIWETVVVMGSDAAPRDFKLAVGVTHDTVAVSETVGYRTRVLSSGTRTLTPLRDIPQSITVVPHELIQDQMVLSIGDVVRYVPGRCGPDSSRVLMATKCQRRQPLTGLASLELRRRFRS